MLTESKLRAFAPASVKYAQGLIKGAQLYQIDKTPNRLVYWLANLAIESDGFTRVVEGLSYSTAERIVLIFRKYFDQNHDKAISPEELAKAREYVNQPEKLANFVYADRMGNGNALSGDGWRFRGQGLPQITGLKNVSAYSMALYNDDRVVRDPTMLQRDPDAALAAAWFAGTNKLNDYADRGDFHGYCGIWNAGNPKVTAVAYDDGDRKDLDSREDWRVKGVSIFA